MKALIPSHLIVLAMIYFGQLQLPYILSLTLPFVVGYILAILIQLYILLKISTEAVFQAKKHDFDPHNSVMPIITSITNMLGAIALAALFTIMTIVDDPNGKIIRTIDNDNDDKMMAMMSTNGTAHLLANSTALI